MGGGVREKEQMPQIEMPINNATSTVLAIKRSGTNEIERKVTITEIWGGGDMGL